MLLCVSKEQIEPRGKHNSKKRSEKAETDERGEEAAGVREAELGHAEADSGLRKAFLEGKRLRERGL